MDWGTLVVGAAFGFALSFAWWVLQWHGIRPAVRPERVVRVEPDDRLPEPTKLRYQVRVWNKSFVRAALEITLDATLRLPKDPNDLNRVEIVAIPTGTSPDTSTLPRLGPRRKHIFDLRTNEIPWQSWIYLTDELRERIKRGDRLKVEELLAMRKNAHLRLYVAATDGLSGSRRVYLADDIREVADRFPGE